MSGGTGLVGADLERAIRLREYDGWSFTRIGREFGVSESGASNAVTAALCVRRGHRPAERDANGYLLPAETERLRFMLTKGLKAVEIQLRMAVSASCVAEQRRRYNAELKAKGKRPLPPPGNGEAYSGARVVPERRKEVERLLLTGMGGPKVADASGVSKTHVVRIRAKLIRRMKRKGEALPGCDLDGNRVTVFDHARAIPDAAKAKLLELLLGGMPCRRAAHIAVIGLSSAYKLRDEFKASGITLPKPKLPGRVGATTSRLLASERMPAAKLFQFRALSRVHGDDTARQMLAEQAAIVSAAPRTFEQQLERVRNGASLVGAFRPHRADPAMTLGGVATGQLA